MSSSETRNSGGNFQQPAQASANQGGRQEQPDWLDKGIQGAGQKAGVNISEQNADKVGDFANRQFENKEGTGLPGVR